MAYIRGMKLTTEDIKLRIAKALAEADSEDDPARYQERMTGVLKWCVENIDHLDEGAQHYLDGVLEKINTEARRIVGELPDGVETRGISRELAKIDRQHVDSKKLVASLADDSQLGPVVDRARQEFEPLLQIVLDLLFDASQRIHEGIAPFAMLALGFRAVDDLVAGLHLAQHGYANQAVSHVRTVLEILDKIDLFHSQPKWAELWMDGTEREIEKELGPSSVRKKLGRRKYDPLYSFFSSIGAHAAFRGLPTRMIVRKDEVADAAAGDRKQIKTWVGGTPLEGQIVMANSMCVYATAVLLSKVAGVFEEHLHQEETGRVLDDAAESFTAFINEYFVGWGDGGGS